MFLSELNKMVKRCNLHRHHAGNLIMDSKEEKNLEHDVDLTRFAKLVT